MVLTMLAPLKNEIRFLQTGNRISMQLKLRHVAEALAQARVDCTYNSIKKLNYKLGKGRAKENTVLIYYSSIRKLLLKHQKFYEGCK